MGIGLQLLFGSVLLLWGTFVVALPRLVLKLAVAAEKSGVAWNPQARWGTAWIRILGGVLGLVGLAMVVTGLFGIVWR